MRVRRREIRIVSDQPLTASQRREAATRLQGWARDLRAAGAATATAAGS